MKRVDELTQWVNWNYLGLAAGVLSVIVTAYNIHQYWQQIQREQAPKLLK
jgi:predicted negative regulator of RcsB-dependent stress response